MVAAVRSSKKAKPKKSQSIKPAKPRSRSKAKVAKALKTPKVVETPLADGSVASAPVKRTDWTWTVALIGLALCFVGIKFIMPHGAFVGLLFFGIGSLLIGSSFGRA